MRVHPNHRGETLLNGAYDVLLKVNSMVSRLQNNQ